MIDLKKVFQSFWAQFGVPAYLSDDVPPTATLPYITYSVSMSDFGGQTIQTAFAWCEKEYPYGNAWRTKMMDDIQTAIPVGGLMIPVGDGYVILYRNPSDFLKDWQDPEDANVLGVRVSCIVQHYHF